MEQISDTLSYKFRLAKLITQKVVIRNLIDEDIVMEKTVNKDEIVDRQFATNLSRGLEVLRAFTVADQLLGNQELCERTGLPKATVFRLTYTLERLGYLIRIERFQKYRLGPGVLMLGYPMLAGMEIRHLVRPHMEKLASLTGWSVNLGMLGKLEVIYIDAMRFDRGNILKPDIGSSRPLLSTAIGRALLAQSSEQERESILNRLRLLDPQTFKVQSELFKKDLEFYEKNQYFLSKGDLAPDVKAIAVPLNIGKSDDPVIAMNCTMSGSKLLQDEIHKQVVPHLLQAKRNIERESGSASYSNRKLSS